MASGDILITVEKRYKGRHQLKSIPKGQFVVMKTGTHPMQTRLRLFLEWGIRFEEPYQVDERAQRTVVAYASKQELEQAILQRHSPQRPERKATPVTVAQQTSRSIDSRAAYTQSRYARERQDERSDMRTKGE